MAKNRPRGSDAYSETSSWAPRAPAELAREGGPMPYALATPSEDGAWVPVQLRSLPVHMHCAALRAPPRVVLLFASPGLLRTEPEAEGEP